MSASREKKKRQEFLAGGGVDPKAVRAAEQQAADKKAKLVYTLLAVVFVVVTALLLVYNSGVMQRGQTAVVIDGEEYSAGDVSFYYYGNYQTFLEQTGGSSYAAMFGLDTSKPLDSQTVPGSGEGEESQTWDEYFKEQAVNSLKYVHAAKKLAEEEGMTLDEEATADFESVIESTKATAKANGMSYKNYLTAVYGPAMSASSYEKCLKNGLLAEMYNAKYVDSLEIPEADVIAEYEANVTSYDRVDGGYVYISTAPETKTDADGKTIEPTEAEIAAAKAEAKALAEDILDQVKKGGDMEKISNSTGKSVYMGGEDMTYTTGMGVDWLFDDSRKAGDIEMMEDEENERYYVAFFNSRHRDETPAYSVRHILINTESISENAQEVTTDMVLAKAEEILASWDGTEEGFAALAEEHSRDTGSSSNGGLYEDVVKGTMVNTFNDWCYEDGREYGDTGLVESDYGYHIMFFVGYSDDDTLDYWYAFCEQDLIDEKVSEWQTALTKDIVTEVQKGMDAVG